MSTASKPQYLQVATTRRVFSGEEWYSNNNTTAEGMELSSMAGGPLALACKFGAQRYHNDTATGTSAGADVLQLTVPSDTGHLSAPCPSAPCFHLLLMSRPL